MKLPKTFALMQFKSTPPSRRMKKPQCCKKHCGYVKRTLSKRAVGRLACGRLHLIDHRSIGGAQLDNAWRNAGDLDAIPRSEPRSLQPPSHEANLRHGYTFPEV